MSDSVVPKATPPTNTEVGARIGLDHSTVSRIRRGERNPSIAVMLKIQDAYDWKIEQQALAALAGKYGEQFEQVLAPSGP